MGKSFIRKYILTREFFSAIVFGGIIIYLIYEHFDFQKLDSNYLITTGTIYEISGVHTTKYYYFYVNGTKYFGLTPYANGLGVGDTLSVRYYVPNPDLNKCEE